MPGFDKTGPRGQGPRTGRGMGTGQGRGRMGGPLAAGPSGFCTCPNCGNKVPHKIGVPCNKQKCPKCGTVMIRE